MRIIPWTCLLTTSLSAALALGCAPISETRESVVTLAEGAPLRVKNPHGAVRVRRRAEGDGLRIQATIFAQDAQRLAASHVIVQRGPEGAEVFVDWAGDAPGEGESVDLVLDVPSWAGLVIETDDGPLAIVGLEQASSDVVADAQW